MMARMEFQTQISAPPQKVFAYVSDLEKHSEWSEIDEVKKTSDGDVGVGSTYESHGKGPMGMATNDRLEVIDYQPNERFGWRSHSGMGMQFEWSFEVKPEGDGSILIERLDPPPGVLSTIIGAFFAMVPARSYRIWALGTRITRCNAGED